MTPIEHAFGDEGGEDGGLQFDADTARHLQASPVLHPPALRDIAHAAQRIEADLSRAVWNGNIALIAAGAEPGAGAHQGAAFSRTLLREIGRTGARTREVFTRALAEGGGTVAAAALAGASARAALAIDVMDRSLYERANDCRWWALTTQFRRALEAPEAADPVALGRILRTIHGLYTVYANLVLFDRHGRVVASSREEGAAAPGRPVEGEWVRRTLALPNTQAYCVSAFEPSALYDGRATWVYAAAVRGEADPSRVVGGVAIVFDGEPQFRSMLQDGLPRDAQGVPVEGAFGVFVGRDGRVIASSDDGLPVGTELAAAAELRSAASRDARVLAWRGRWYSVGVSRSTGYREFKGEGDPYREDVTALAFDALTDATAAELPVTAPPPAPQRSLVARGTAGAERIDLATLRIGAQWHALAGHDLVEAIRADGLLPLPGTAAHVRGSVMFRNAPIAVLDADRLLGRSGDAVPSQERQIVVLRPRGARGQAFGLLVDALGDNPQVAPNQLIRLAEGAWQRGPTGAALIDTVVAAAPGANDRELLTLLSADALCSLL
jgi:chemotaxis signal transduction protein